MIDPNSVGLGRLPSLDARDANYPMAKLFAAPLPLLEGLSTPSPGDYYWNAPRPYFDQGSRSICVGASWSHWLASSPVYTRDGPDPETIYRNAQILDEWPGEEPVYAGTSVRAGAKYLQSLGRIASYFWAKTLAEVIECIKTRGPVVAGTDWTMSMLNPPPGEILDTRGSVIGGHAYIIIGLSDSYRVLRCLNSWGDWTPTAGFWLRYNDFERLLLNDGEACTAIEQPIVLNRPIINVVLDPIKL